MLLDDLRTLAKEAEFAGCIVGKWLQTQDKEVVSTLSELAKKPGLNLSTTLTLIKKHDPAIPFKRTAFVYHMRGTCACQAI